MAFNRPERTAVSNGTRSLYPNNQPIGQTGPNGGVLEPIYTGSRTRSIETLFILSFHEAALQRVSILSRRSPC